MTGWMGSFGPGGPHLSLSVDECSYCPGGERDGGRLQ